MSSSGVVPPCAAGFPDAVVQFRSSVLEPVRVYERPTQHSNVIFSGLVEWLNKGRNFAVADPHWSVSEEGKDWVLTESGFVKVQCMDLPDVVGFVRAAEVRVLYYPRQRQVYVHLDARTWYGSHWVAPSTWCSIRVSDSPPSADPDVTDIAFSTEKQREKIALMLQDGYTYVCLDGLYAQRSVDTPNRPDGHVTMCPSKAAHITIGKGARMTSEDRDALHRKLERVLLTWINTSPHQRPFHKSIFHSKSFTVRRNMRESMDWWERSRIVMWEPDDVEAHLEDGRIFDQFSEFAPEEAGFDERVKRLYARDSERLEEAVKRSQSLVDHDGWFSLQAEHHAHSDLHPVVSYEVLDLCEYLAEGMLFDPRTHFTVRKADGKVKLSPPYVLERGNFHATRPTDWMTVYQGDAPHTFAHQ